MELITIVDEQDNVIGMEEKNKCHDGDGILHRAFLTMAFTPSGELLLARRSDNKRLWPGYWDGTVASHLWEQEGYEQASVRRLQQELGLTCQEVNYLFKFRYKVAYLDLGTEHEICAVTTVDGVEPSALNLDPNEISELRAIPLSQLMSEINEPNIHYTPWLILALEEMNKAHK